MKPSANVEVIVITTLKLGRFLREMGELVAANGGGRISGNASGLIKRSILVRQPPGKASRAAAAVWRHRTARICLASLASELGNEARGLFGGRFRRCKHQAYSLYSIHMSYRLEIDRRGVRAGARADHDGGVSDFSRGSPSADHASTPSIKMPMLPALTHSRMLAAVVARNPSWQPGKITLQPFGSAADIDKLKMRIGPGIPIATLLTS
jgi:hypothetical protein